MHKIIAIKRILDMNTPRHGEGLIRTVKNKEDVQLIKCPFSLSFLVNIKLKGCVVSNISFNDNGKMYNFSTIAEFNRHLTKEKKPDLRKVYPL